MYAFITLFSFVFFQSSLTILYVSLTFHRKRLTLYQGSMWATKTHRFKWSILIKTWGKPSNQRALQTSLRCNPIQVSSFQHVGLQIIVFKKFGKMTKAQHKYNYHDWFALFMKRNYELESSWNKMHFDEGSIRNLSRIFLILTNCRVWLWMWQSVKGKQLNALAMRTWSLKIFREIFPKSLWISIHICPMLLLIPKFVSPRKNHWYFMLRTSLTYTKQVRISPTMIPNCHWARKPPNSHNSNVC